MQIITADLYDKYTDRIVVCETPFLNFGKRSSFHGQCETICVFEDHTPLKEMLSRKVDNRILIVDGGGSLRVGVFGDSYATIGCRNGWAGVIVYGATRDTAFLRSIDIGVKALGATARKGLVPTVGRRNVRVEFGAAVFEPGDWIYADPDCVLVSKSELEIPSRGTA